MDVSRELYLIRHGVAEARGEAWPDDAKRPLTGEGMTKLRKAIRGLAQIGVAFDVILTSPLLRARQTADIVASAFDPRPPGVVVTEALLPGATYQALLAELEKHARRKRIALVGHEPGLGELAARLTGSRQPFAFKKGGVCRIDVERVQSSGTGALRWFLTPRIMRALKR